MRLSHIECFPAAHVLFMLDTLAERLLVYKPRSFHSSRGTFYAIAKGICSGGPGGGGRCGADKDVDGGGNGWEAARRRKERRESLRAGYLAGLRRLWQELRFGGERGTGRAISPGDLDFVASADEILDGYVDRLVGMGRQVWETQVEGLSGLFRHKGIGAA